METYSNDLRSSTQLRLIVDPGLAARVLDRAEDEVHRNPRTLPLWTFRCAQWQKRGRLGYQEVWRRLQRAALSAGAKEAWVDRCLYHGFSYSNAFRTAPPELAMLAMLARGLQ
jgi:hypothetical protein